MGGKNPLSIHISSDDFPKPDVLKALNLLGFTGFTLNVDPSVMGDIKVKKALDLLGITDKAIKNREYITTDRVNEIKEDIIRKILIIRAGGIGDVIMLIPVFREFKRLYPKAKITMLSDGNSAKILNGDPHIDVIDSIGKLSSIRETTNLMAQYDRVIDFTGVIENNPEAQKMNGYRLHLKWAGIDRDDIEIEDMRPEIHLSDEEIKNGEAFVNKIKPKKDSPVVVMQLRASSWVRSWIPEYVRLTGEMLGKAGVGVIICSESGLTNIVFAECKCGWHGIIELPICVTELEIECPNCKDKDSISPSHWDDMENVTLLVSNSSIRNIASIIRASDLVIAPDSCFLHIAAAFRTPSLGLYSAFNGMLRAGIFPEAHIIQNTKLKCSPCFLHKAMCPKGLPAPCMQMIKPDEVVNKTLEILNY